MAELRISDMFRGSTRQHGAMPVEVVLPRVKELFRKLGEPPKWLLQGGFIGDSSGRYPIIGYDSAVGREESFVVETDTAGKAGNGRGRNIQLTERKMSSRIRVLNLVGIPTEGGALFRLFAKLKERQQIRALWEFVMLDTWSRVLQAYTARSNLRLSAPRPLSIFPQEGEVETDCVLNAWLMMTYCKGAIVNKLSVYKTPKSVTLRDHEYLSFNQALALHLGRLAGIKGAEKLVHGDPGLRHFLFSYGANLQLKPGQTKNSQAAVLPSLVGILSAEFGAVVGDAIDQAIRDRMIADYDKTDPEIRHLVCGDGTAALAVEFKPVRLSVIDVEKSQIDETGRKVERENDEILNQFLRTFGDRKGSNRRAFEDGFNAVEPLNVLPQIDRQQQAVLGFSFNQLF